MSMVGVNYWFIVMKARREEKCWFYRFCIHAHTHTHRSNTQVKRETFQSGIGMLEHISWTIIIVLSYKYSSNETIASKKQRHELADSHWTTEEALGQYSSAHRRVLEYERHYAKLTTSSRKILSEFKGARVLIASWRLTFFLSFLLERKNSSDKIICIHWHRWASLQRPSRLRSAKVCVHRSLLPVSRARTQTHNWAASVVRQNTCQSLPFCLPIAYGWRNPLLFIHRSLISLGLARNAKERADAPQRQSSPELHFYTHVYIYIYLYLYLYIHYGYLFRSVLKDRYKYLPIMIKVA